VGGEPLEPENQPDVLHLLQRVKEKHPSKDVWIYTGFVYEELKGSRADTPFLDEILKKTDVLVDGPFEKDKADSRLLFRGSSNQRILRNTGGYFYEIE